MKTEVLTNGQFQNPSVHEALLDADLVGVSLDGPNPGLHDNFRDKSGNFIKIQQLLDLLDLNNRPYVIRTVASLANWTTIPEMVPEILRRPGVRRWSIQEFSPIEDGYRRRSRYALAEGQFLELVTLLFSLVDGRVEMTALSHTDKNNLYFLIDPGGNVLDRAPDPTDGVLRIVGNTLESHLSDLADRLAVDRVKQQKRYDSWFGES